MQIIIATHSPISLSDIPRRHVNLFNKKESKGGKVKRTIHYGDELGINNTFGANIHELFAESFFLQGQLIGDFALAKIKGIVDGLNTEQIDNKQVEQIGQLIPLIGEPLIRSKLQRMYDDKYAIQRMSDEQKLQFHQEQIKLIKARKK